MLSVLLSYAIAVDLAKAFILALGITGCPMGTLNPEMGIVGLKVVTYPGSHFSLNMLMNLHTMTRVLTVLGSEFAWGKTMRSAGLAWEVRMAILP
jgi:hypothetical protein